MGNRKTRSDYVYTVEEIDSILDALRDAKEAKMREFDERIAYWRDKQFEVIQLIQAEEVLAEEKEKDRE